MAAVGSSLTMGIPQSHEAPGLQVYSMARLLLQEGSTPADVIRVLIAQGIPEEQASAVTQLVDSKRERAQLKELVLKCIEEGMTTEEIARRLLRGKYPEDKVAF